MTTLHTRLSIPPDVIFHELSGEAVLLNLQSGKYFGLDEVGTRIWSLLAEHGTPAEIIRHLLKEYDVDEKRLSADLLRLVDELVEHGLLNIEDLPSGDAA